MLWPSLEMEGDLTLMSYLDKPKVCSHSVQTSLGMLANDAAQDMKTLKLTVYEKEERVAAVKAWILCFFITR